MKKVVSTDKAPRPVGPYSQAVVAGDLVFVAGMVPNDPESGDFLLGSLADEARRALTNLQNVLEAAGSGLKEVVKVTVYLTDLGEYAAFNTVYGEFFKTDYPARAVIQAAALPRGCKVEIDAVALVKDEVTY